MGKETTQAKNQGVDTMTFPDSVRCAWVCPKCERRCVKVKKHVGKHQCLSSCTQGVKIER